MPLPRRLACTALLAAATAAGPAAADPIPAWARGRWVATAALVRLDGPAEDVAFFTRSFTASYAQLLPRTTLTIGAHTLRAPPGGAGPLALARHADATAGSIVPRTLLRDPGQPAAFGTAPPHDLDAPVPSVRLAISGCGEPDVQGQAEAPPLRTACRSTYTLLRFPDADHLALWSANGSELLIYARPPPTR